MARSARPPGMPTPHDHLFKHTFADPAHAAAILRTALARRVEWSTLEVLPNELVGDELTAKHSDLLFQVRIGGRPARLILLLEHQSGVDLCMLLRLLGYMLEIWRDHQREHPGERLPVVVPIVLHHSASGWTAATELVELMDMDPDDREALLLYFPNFRMVLDD